MSSPDDAVSDNQELVNSVIEVTGSNQAEAEHLLAACANNVEAAVALFFEQGALPMGNGTEESLPSISEDPDEDGVRAPIAPIREQLIGPEDDNFLTAASSARTARTAPRVKVCPFRDFAREGALMEDELQAAASSLEGNSSSNASSSSSCSSSSTNVSSPGRSRRRARAGAMVASAMDRKSRLDDLFRPPTDIAYAGAFQTARLRATELKHWLLVNVQNDSFDSQVLNRDVWADKEVRKLIRRQFMLWQVDVDTSEGRRFVAFYHCIKLPYVCIIDPRTGEEVWKSAEPKQTNVLQDLQSFLLEHKDFSEKITDGSPTALKRSTECVTVEDDEDDGGLHDGVSNHKKRAKIVELSEEEQIAIAIRNSIRENRSKQMRSLNEDDEEGADSDLEEFGEDDVKNSCDETSYEIHLGQRKDELTMLKLRLINDKQQEEVVQLRWPSDTQLKVLRLYIAQTFPNITKKGYKIICAFPRKTLEAEYDSSTLKEVNLHPSANLHVTLDD